MSIFPQSDYACRRHTQDQWVGNDHSDWTTLNASPLESGFRPTMSLRAHEVNNQLTYLSQLQDGWDGDGAEGISGASISSARSIIDDLRIRCRNRGWDLPVPVISACRNGSVDLYWSSKNGKILANIASNGSFEFAVKTSDGLRINGTKKHISALVDYLRGHE